MQRHAFHMYFIHKRTVGRKNNYATYKPQHKKQANTLGLSWSMTK